MRFLTSHLILQGCLFLSLCLPSNIIWAAVAQYKSEDDERFKAAFIYNFAKFTNWPELSFKENESLVLCIASNNKLGYALNRLSGKTIKGRQLIIKPLIDDKLVDQCHMLYIEKSLKNQYKKLLKLTHEKPILTVSDISSFANKGGIIQFYRKNGRTHLIINLDIARKSNLEISSRLLIIAKVINTPVTP